jgi:hypothetical protein
MVPSPASTASTLGLYAAASANARSILSDSPDQISQLVTPASLRISSISASESALQPPLEVLIIAPTLSAEISMLTAFIPNTQTGYAKATGGSTTTQTFYKGNRARCVGSG